MGACPVGAMQTFFGGLRFNLSVAQKKFGLYVAGFLAAVGSAVGRMPCGWVCPFGFVQELVHKIPSPKIQIPHFLTYFRYVVLATTVVALPLLIVDQFGYGQTWFCKWICPAGTLEAGIPLMLIKADLRPLIGFMYYWKLGLLVLFLGLVRPQPAALLPDGLPSRRLLGPVQQGQPVPHGRRRRKVHPLRQVPQGLPRRDQASTRSANSPDCVRCLKCVSSCKFGAISYEFLGQEGSLADLSVKNGRACPPSS
ncbi:MAG: 4Fe-4S binding protein [Candidatus Moduliflexus flocculans]|nr:4Fe-4S binding protein [Candidatus Moduliflexus flocculans]